MKFRIEGKPQGKARARTFYNKRMGKMQSITPEQTKSYEELIRWSYKAAGGKYYGEKVLQVDINAFYQIPKVFSKVKRIAALNGDLRPTSKPDLDNLCKVVLDALNGVAYCDDRFVVSVAVNKYYAENLPYVEVEIKELTI